MKLVAVKIPDALAARITDKGDEVVVIIKEKGDTIIKVIDAIDDVVDDLIEVGTPLFRKIAKFFQDIFDVLPTYIDYHGVKYRLTMQPAQDDSKVLYLIEDGYEGDKVLFLESEESIVLAKKAMRKNLKSKGYLN